MKARLVCLVFVVAILNACSGQTRKTPEFPLKKGTTWIYLYNTYEQAADPSQLIGATHQLTESVVDVKLISSYLVAHVVRDFRLVVADRNWTGDFSSQPKEFWYVVNDQQIFQSYQPPDDANINTSQLPLAYTFPLTVNKSWCLTPLESTATTEIMGCDSVGRREVTNQSSYETPAGNFDDCFDLTDYYNGGNILQKFCNGIGVVYMKFDHAGTRFGFEQTLIDYSPGTP